VSVLECHFNTSEDFAGFGFCVSGISYCLGFSTEGDAWASVTNTVACAQLQLERISSVSSAAVLVNFT